MPGLDHFGLLAPWYDKLISYGEEEKLIRWAELPFSGNLLDIGGGTGRVARSLIDEVENIEIVDVSYKMLKIAKKKGLSTTCALGEMLPYPNGYFARAIIIDALHHCINQQEVITEVWRVLQPGGLLVIVEPNYNNAAGKWIRLFEKLILMKSHFLTDSAILSLLIDFTDKIKIKHTKGNSWFKVKK